MFFHDVNTVNAGNYIICVNTVNLGKNLLRQEI